MKILHTVEFYSPSVGGMQEVVRQLSEHLVRLRHDVTVATTKLSDRKEKVINGVKIVEFDISGNMVREMKGEVGPYEDYLLNTDFDIITNFAAQQWATDIMLPLLENVKAKKVFVPTGFSGLYQPEYKEYFESMKSWLHRYDMNVFLSDDYRDVNFARDCGVKIITLIPNGAGEDEFLPDINLDIRKLLGIPQQHFLILHVGSHTGIKGHAEAIKMFSKARIRNATFLIVANDFGGGCVTACKWKTRFFYLRPKHKFYDKRLIVTSLPRKETVAAYKEADMFLFPSNIECSPLVLFESMASKTPFLTTDVGNAAEIVKWSKAGILLPTIKDANGNSKAVIKDSVKILEDIYANPSKRNEMQESGFKAWQERFTWGKIAMEYENMYQNLVRGGRSVFSV
jgi:glycosyltransferase involved in cell wall biosynthesis